MELLSNNFFQFVLAFFVFGVLSVPLIGFLYKNKFYKSKKPTKKAKKTRNPLFYKHLTQSLDTPSSFGILFSVYFIIWLLIMGDKDYFIGIFVSFVLLSALGFYDDYIKYFNYKKNNAWGLSRFSKFLLQCISVLPFVIFSINTDLYSGIVLLFFILFFINSYNFTDGLDGLVGNITLFILPVLFLFESLTYSSPIIFGILAVIFAFILVFMYFNVKPARVFLGDVGSLSIGFLIVIIGLRYGLLNILLLFSLILFEGLSSLIQIVSIRYFNKRVFKIAPYHLNLLNKGWPDTKIVQRAGIIQILVSILSVFVFITFNT